MSLGGQEIRNAMVDLPIDGNIPVQAYSSGGKSGALTPQETQALRYYIASQPAVIDQFNNAGLIVDPTALAQQAILARPPRQSTYQPLLSGYISSGGTDGTGIGTGTGTGGAIGAPRPSYTGLMYPSVNRPSISVPSYTSRYEGGGGGGGGGSDTSSGGGYAAVPDYSIPVSEMGTYVGNTMIDPSPYTGVGNPAEEAAAEAYAYAITQAQNQAAADAYSAAAEAAAASAAAEAQSISDQNTGGDGGGYGGYSDGGGSGSFGEGQYSTGGLVDQVNGPNPIGPDDGAGMLQLGEYVIRKKAVKKYGKNLLDMINSGKFKG